MEPTPRLLQEWRNRVSAEYTSAAITAQTLHWMIVCGLDTGLIETCQRIVRDELEHARLSHETLTALGGPDEAVQLDPGRLVMPSAPEGPLASLLDSILRNFCLGETFAVPLFNEMRRGTDHPAVLPMLTRVLQDEAVHRAFGWEALDALLEMDAAGVRARAAAVLPAMLESYRRAYASVREAPPLSDFERSAGMMAPATYADVHDRTLLDDIRQRFARRGIALPDASLPGQNAPRP